MSYNFTCIVLAFVLLSFLVLCNEQNKLEMNDGIQKKGRMYNEEKERKKDPQTKNVRDREQGGEKEEL